MEILIQFSNFDMFQTGCTIGTKKTEKLENRFESELVQANEKARKKFPEPEDNKLKAHDFLHFHDSGGYFVSF